MKPHAWKIGDAVVTTYNRVGVVMETTLYGVVLCRGGHDRCFHSQTLIARRADEKEDRTVEVKKSDENPHAKRAASKPEQLKLL